MIEKLLTILLYGFFIIYFFSGVYGLSLNKEARLNRVYFVLSMGFSIWALSFAMMNSARNFDEAFFWHKVSALGWGTVYSLLVHFVLVISDRKVYLKQKLTYVLIYLPAVINIFLFVLFANVQDHLHNLIHAPAGWTSIPMNNFTDNFFNVYYLSFSLMAIIFLIRWYFITKEIKEKKYVIYIVCSFLITLFLGTFTDILANRFLAVKIPSLAPIFISIPVITIYKVIHKYGLMLPKEEKPLSKEGLILTEFQRVRLFRFVAICILIGSLGNLGLYFILGEALQKGAILSTVLVVFGTCAYVVPSFVKSTNRQDFILLFLLALIMPITLLSNNNLAISNVLWPIPLLIIMTMTVFNNTKTFEKISLVCVSLGIISWFILPQTTLKIGHLDYLFRMVVYGMGIVLAASIYGIYMNRLKLNERQVETQKLISKISTDFVTVTNNNYEQKVSELLETCANFLKVDRAFLLMLTEDQRRILTIKEWTMDNIQSVFNELEGQNLEDAPWSSSQLMNNQIVNVVSQKSLPKEAVFERAFLEKHQIQA